MTSLGGKKKTKQKEQTNEKNAARKLTDEYSSSIIKQQRPLHRHFTQCLFQMMLSTLTRVTKNFDFKAFTSNNSFTFVCHS